MRKLLIISGGVASGKTWRAFKEVPLGSDVQVMGPWDLNSAATHLGGTLIVDNCEIDEVPWSDMNRLAEDTALHIIVCVQSAHKLDIPRNVMRRFEYIHLKKRTNRKWTFPRLNKYAKKLKVWL